MSMTADALRASWPGGAGGTCPTALPSVEYLSKRGCPSHTSTCTTVQAVNPLRHTIEADSAGPAMSAPSTANARLQVTGSSCHLAGSLPASRQCSDRPGFDGLDFAGHGFLMTDDVAEELLVSAEVIAGFRFTRV